MAVNDKELNLSSEYPSETLPFNKKLMLCYAGSIGKNFTANCDLLNLYDILTPPVV